MPIAQAEFTINDLSDVVYQDTPPENPPIGLVWGNTSVNPNELLRWTGNGIQTDRRYAASRSGSFVDLDDLSDYKALTAVVKIITSQTGSGDPSPTNIRPLNKRTILRATRVGKNRAPSITGVTTSGDVTYTPQDDGMVLVQGVAGASGSVRNILGELNGTSQVLSLSGKTVSMSGGSPGVYFQLTYYDGVSWTTKRVNSSRLTFTIPSNCIVTRLNLGVNTGVSVGSTVYYQLEVGPVASVYEKYLSTEYTFTVKTPPLCGLTGLEGEIGNDGREVHRAKVFTCRGTSGFSHLSAAQKTNTALFQCSLPTSPPSGVAAQSICTHYVRDTNGYNVDTEGHYVFNTVRIRIAKSRLTGWSDGLTDAEKVALFNTWLEAQNTAGTPLEVVYELASVITNTFDPVEILGVNGINRVSGDGSSITVMYTGSGWEAVGSVQRVEIENVQINKEKGLRIDTILTDGSTSVPVYFNARGTQIGLYRLSDDKQLWGGRLMPGGRVVTVTDAMIDPDGDGSSLFLVQTSDGKTFLSLDMDSYEGVTNEANPSPAGRMSGVKMGAYNAWTWQLGDYADDWYSYVAGKGRFEISSDGQLVLFATNGIVPGYFAGGLDPLEGGYNLGAVNRWRRLYCTMSVDVSSDARQKDFVGDVPEDFILKLRPRLYRRKDDPDKRLRMGLYAQEVKEALGACGLTDADLLGDDNPDSLSLRYEELIAPLIATMQSQQRQIKEQGRKIEALLRRLGAEED